MKISKKNKVVTTSENHIENITAKSKIEASQHVKAAINCLTSCAKDDDLAKEALANLSIVNLQLK